VGDNSLGGGIDLKSEINLAEDKQKLRDYGAHAAADWCVYFGWKIKPSEKHSSVLGKTLVDQTVIDFGKFNKGDESKLAHTLAHELGHYVVKSDPPHDTQKTDLMFDTAAVDSSNNKIRKKRCQMVIRP
jgi:Zn-dependent peptidase ImmA (M78 family)